MHDIHYPATTAMDVQGLRRALASPLTLPTAHTYVCM
eukprot:COSAG01_NODE_57144_length_314_cov_0.720930_1_plen_36_part_10